MQFWVVCPGLSSLHCMDLLINCLLNPALVRKGISVSFCKFCTFCERWIESRLVHDYIDVICNIVTLFIWACKLQGCTFIEILPALELVVVTPFR